MRFEVVLLGFYLLSIAGIIKVEPWTLVAMYLLSRMVGSFGGRQADEEGGEPGVSGNPSYGYSMVQGRRDYMEDFTFAHVDMTKQGGSSTCFFGVFDGHSGKRAAAWAKDKLWDNVQAELVKGVQPPEALKNAFLATDREFLLKAKKDRWMDGCTVSTALLIGKDLYVANAGDSRTILCRGSEAVPMSQDHKPDRPSERRRIVQAGGSVIFVGCARVNGVLATSRGFGDKDLKQWVSAEPEVTQRTLSPGDDTLILATDGLWDVLTNSETAQLVAREGGNVKQAAKALTREALRLGSMDNISALVVDLRPIVEPRQALQKAFSMPSSPMYNSSSSSKRTASPFSRSSSFKDVGGGLSGRSDSESSDDGRKSPDSNSKTSPSTRVKKTSMFRSLIEKSGSPLGQRPIPTVAAHDNEGKYSPRTAGIGSPREGRAVIPPLKERPSPGAEPVPPSAPASRPISSLNIKPADTGGSSPTGATSGGAKDDGGTPILAGMAPAETPPLVTMPPSQLGEVLDTDDGKMYHY
mmetsp:Transcript_43031/g.105204  ORF Transcript_43031/g.105204 Transcript_43031/m.105204 type:complete len:524 (-) Transcript_43031:107-1678(-)